MAIATGAKRIFSDKIKCSPSDRQAPDRIQQIVRTQIPADRDLRGSAPAAYPRILLQTIRAENFVDSLSKPALSGITVRFNSLKPWVEW